MDVYYDTGVLVALYVEEAFSSSVNAFVEKRGEPIAINLFLRLEFENTVRLKVFRRDIKAERARRVLQDLDDDLDCGRLYLRPLELERGLRQSPCDQLTFDGASRMPHVGCVSCGHCDPMGVRSVRLGRCPSA